MKSRQILSAVLLSFFWIFPAAGWADYDQELKTQIREIKQSYPALKAEYFRDMGVIARKADDAERDELLAGMVRDLWKDAAVYVREEMDLIDQMFGSEGNRAASRLQDLFRFHRYFQVSENFQGTALGQSLAADGVQKRETALQTLTASCSRKAIQNGAEAVLASSLFVTNSSSEIDALRKLDQALGCCTGWKREIRFYREQDFETDYELGLLTEEAHLRLVSRPSDFSQARWEGDWYYHFTGREGKGQGTSRAVLTYHKGADLASLVITAARLSSAGRMNFPNAVSGETRTLEVMGAAIYPQLDFYSSPVEVIGCYIEKRKK